MTRRPILGCRVRSGFGYRWIYVTPSAMQEMADIGGSVAILVRALWKRWRMFRRVALGRSRLSVLVVLLLCRPW
jgi:hypothetical protein